MRHNIWLVLLTLAWFLPPVWAQGVDVFVGNRSFSDDQLLTSLKRDVPDFHVLLLYKPDTAEQMARRLERFYKHRGFPLASVRLEKGQGNPTLQISEGPRASLGLMQFQGNQVFPNQQLVELASLDNHFESDRLEKGFAEIRRAYRNEGYMDIEVGPVSLGVMEVEKEDHFPVPFRRRVENRARLTIPIKEGPRYYYGAVHLPEELLEAELRPPQQGQIYREEDLLQFRERVEDHFVKQNRLVKNIDVYQSVRADADLVDLSLQYQLLPQLAIRRIEFKGNSRYPDSFYRRGLKITEQDLLDPQKLRESLSEIGKTGVLESYSAVLDLDEANSEVDVIIHLEEKDRQRIAYSFGSDGLGGLEGTFLYFIFNLLGLGEELGLEVGLGSQTGEFAVSMASRYLLGTTLPMSMALRFFKRHTGLDIPDADQAIRRLLKVDQVGFSAATSYRLRSNQRLGAVFVGERVTTASGHSTNLVLEPYWGTVETSEWMQVKRLQLSQRFSLFDGALDSWNLRPAVDYRQYFPGPKSKSPTFAFRLRATHARFFGDSAPVTERLFEDPWGVRGFDALSAGPWARFGESLSPVGGDTLVTFNSEYRIPLTDTYAAVPFLDTGFNAALTDASGYRIVGATRKVWRTSLGSELQVRLPAALPTARIIFAWNPFRLDRQLITSHGLSRLRDPAKVLRFAIGPSF